MPVKFSSVPKAMARTAVAIGALAATSACADGADLKPDAGKSAQATAIIEAALKAAPYPGLAVAVEQKGKIVFEGGYGYSDVDKKIVPTATTQFPIGSVTKSFTCLGVQQLRAAGKLDPKKTVGDYLPSITGPDAGVTLVQLMEHTSGIPNYTDLPDFPHSKPVGLTRADVVKVFSTKPLLFKSGSEFNYSNSDTYLLGMIIEKVSGQSYTDYISDHVLKPFGMSRTNLEAHDTGAPDRARGYRLSKTGFAPSIAYDYDVPFSAGVIVSTAEDLLKYRAGVFGPKSDPTVQKYVLQLDPLSGGEANPYGRGCLIQTQLDGHRKITHSGDIYGFAAHYAYYPDDDLTIAVLVNGQGAFPPLTVEHKLARVFLNLPSPDLTDRPVPEALGQAVAGDYKMGKFRFGIDALGFVYKDGKVALSFGGLGSGAPLLPLKYIGDNRFVSIIDDEHLFDFKSRPDGATELVMHYYEGEMKAVRLAAKP